MYMWVNMVRMHGQAGDTDQVGSSVKGYEVVACLNSPIDWLFCTKLVD